MLIQEAHRRCPDTVYLRPRMAQADLRRLSLTQLQTQVGPRAATSLYQQARGIASDQVGARAARRSLSNSRRSARPWRVARRSSGPDSETSRQTRAKELAGTVEAIRVLAREKSDRTLSDISITLQPVMPFQTSRRLP